MHVNLYAISFYGIVINVIVFTAERVPKDSSDSGSRDTRANLRFKVKCELENRGFEKLCSFFK